MVERRSRGREVFVVVGERCGAMAGVNLAVRFQRDVVEL